MHTSSNHQSVIQAAKSFSLSGCCCELFRACICAINRYCHYFYQGLLSLKLLPVLSRPAVSVLSRRFETHSEETVRHLVAVMIALLSLSALFVLYLFRDFDDNRLTSWQWVFANNEIFVIAIMLLPVLWLSWWLTTFALRPKKTLLLLLLSAFVMCALQWSQPEIIVDASRYFLQAKSLASNGAWYFINQWGDGISAWTDLPLIPFLYGVVFDLLGEHRVAIQFLTTLLFCGSVLLTFLIGRQLWDQTVALYGAALLLAMPYVISQVPLMLVDIPSMFFLLLAVYSLLLAVKTQAFSWSVIATISIILAMLCKYSNWLMLSVLGVIVLCCRQCSWRHLHQQLLPVFGVVALFFIFLLVWKYEAISRQFVLLRSYQLPGLSRWHETHLSTFFYQLHPFISLAAISSVYFAWRKRDRHYLVISWMLLLVLLLDIQRSRYVLIVLPMLALMAAYGLRQISDSRLRNYTVLCILVSSLAVTFCAYSPFLRSTSASNIKQAGEYINNLNASTVEVILLAQTQSDINPFVSLPLLDLFVTKKIIYWKSPNLVAPGVSKKSATSALRFSWLYKAEDYYQSSNAIQDKLIIIVAETKSQSLPAPVSARLKGFYLKKRFTQHEGVYRYSTIVDVYEADTQRQSAELIQG